MNKRIEEVLNQVLDMEEFEHVEEFLDTKFAEKFAELIAKECARRCEDIAIKHSMVETTYAAGKKSGAFECAVDLKEHFGVK